MLLYVMECYSAGWSYIIQHDARRAKAKVAWGLHWITEEEAKPLADRPWPITKGWWMKFGGLPFHEYVFSRYLPEDKALLTNGDREMRRLAAAVFDSPPKVTQLSMFMLMSYAERLNPGAFYREDDR